MGAPILHDPHAGDGGQGNRYARGRRCNACRLACASAQSGCTLLCPDCCGCRRQTTCFDPMNTAALQKKYGFENPFVPDPLVRKAIRYCKGARVLDVGCGEGADSVYYSKNGFAVTAIDKNAAYV